MKKNLIILLAFLMLSASFAQEKNAVTQKEPVFSMDNVKRYEGYAVGGHFVNQYAIGYWSEFAVTNIGLDAAFEYTLPAFLPFNLDLGVSGKLGYGYVVPKADSTLKSDSELSFLAGVWVRWPFSLWGQYFAFQPEVDYGLFLHCAQGQNYSEASGVYADSTLSINLSLRYMAPVDALSNIEFVFAPTYTLGFEKNGFAVNQLGFELGAMWHMKDFVAQKKIENEEKKRLAQLEKERILKEEEERKRAELQRIKDEEEKARLAEELRKAEESRLAAEAEAARKAEEERIKREAEEARLAAEAARRAEIAAWPKAVPAVTVSPKNFTPDGDGLNDKLTFAMDIKYLEETPESWVISITDPQGNPFRTIKGKGALPETVEWDGKSDKGEVVLSKSNYGITVSVTPGKVDRNRLGESAVKTEVSIQTGLLLEVIVPDHEWKMVVNALQFAGGGASFDGLDKKTLDANNETLDEVAKMIKERPGATVFVQGYANNVSGSEKENVEELIPLSQARAEFIVEQLVKRGIKREALTAEGKGGADPIASRRDRANWWKNRRIEFLIKK